MANDNIKRLRDCINGTFEDGADEMNRDYFARPIQGNGRDTYDYGRTHLVGKQDGDDQPSGAFLWMMGIFVGLAVVVPLLWLFGR